jgi:phenylalanine ammonia-lyase
MPGFGLIENAFLLTLQENLIWGHKCGVGGKLPPEHVRAAMLIRANALSRGASGVRKEVIERMLAFLNHGLTPVVRELGSIGASGDLIPLAQVAGCIVGLGDSYRAVNREGEEVDALSALESMGLAPLRLQVREQVTTDRDGFQLWPSVGALVTLQKETKTGA